MRSSRIAASALLLPVLMAARPATMVLHENGTVGLGGEFKVNRMECGVSVSPTAATLRAPRSRIAR